MAIVACRRNPWAMVACRLVDGAVAALELIPVLWCLLLQLLWPLLCGVVHHGLVHFFLLARTVELLQWSSRGTVEPCSVAEVVTSVKPDCRTITIQS